MSSRLPETELANWSFLSSENKRRAIERHIAPKKIVGSYEPFRMVLSDAVNKQLPLFSDLEQPATSWNEIERRLGQHPRCRREPETLAMNLEIARATHTFAQDAKITAIPIEVTSLAFGVGHLYEFGLPLLMRYPDKVVGVFLDLRRSNGVSPDAREWIFSAMHERFRAAYPDLASIGLELWRYQANKSRSISVSVCSEVRYSFDDLVADVRETYAIYAHVLSGDRDIKRSATGGAGPLFD